MPGASDPLKLGEQAVAVEDGAEPADVCGAEPEEPVGRDCVQQRLCVFGKPIIGVEVSREAEKVDDGVRWPVCRGNLLEQFQGGGEYGGGGRAFDSVPGGCRAGFDE
jgi:hypothetical protein